MSNADKCFFCGTECEVYTAPLHHRLKQYDCEYCGVYQLGERPGIYGINIKDPSIKFKIACVLNERRLKGLGRVTLVGKKDANVKVNEFSIILIDEILDEFPKKASDFVVRALLNLSRLVKQPFDKIELNLEPVGKYNIFSQDGDFFLRELENQGWIYSCSDSNSWEFWSFTLTTKCWEMIENLQQQATDSKRVFVAMWFDSSMSDFYEKGVKLAIEKAGYIPVRIDLQEFNNKICDEIIAEIKRCKFLVSDFSGQRGGVYFEAGYAMGKGKAVIFTVKEDDVKDLHFDTRQYNHIVYNSPEDLCKKLYNRISATIV
ncbi:MAG TPA: hypothetical protein HPP66_02000 [Planctomycetes bacterium]|nr:hypothetical protein [Planctomycetota bacterium]